jgi:hypothetical protein
MKQRDPGGYVACADFSLKGSRFQKPRSKKIRTEGTVVTEDIFSENITIRAHRALRASFSLPSFLPIAYGAFRSPTRPRADTPTLWLIAPRFSASERQLRLIGQNPSKGSGTEFRAGSIQPCPAAAHEKHLMDLFRQGPFAAHSGAEFGTVQFSIPQ